MEKLIYLAWRSPDESADKFRDRLLDIGSSQLPAVGALGVRLAAADSTVEAAAPLAQSHLCDAPDALVSLWLESAHGREPAEALLASTSERLCGYSVAESSPLVVSEEEGARVEGMNQVVFLQRPERLTREEWLYTWLELHTPVAIETQSTFAYRQNIVTRALTPDAPAIDAIVEEGFPAAAMTSPLAFYGVETEADMQAQLSKMIDSCARFIDFDKLNVLPTSDYLLKRLAPAL